MPYKKKLVKSAELRAKSDELDRLINSAPAHIKARSAKPSHLSKSLNDKFYNWNGLSAIDGENMGLHPNHGKGGNNLRKKMSLAWALKMAKKYPKLLWERNGASSIAKKENVHASTVRSAKRKLQQNEQAK